MINGKFIVTDTFNGEGYSSENGTTLKMFNSLPEAFTFAKDLAHRFADENSQLLVQGREKISFQCADGFGAVHIAKLPKDAYAIKYTCNLNEIEILTKDEHNEFLYGIYDALEGLGYETEDYIEHNGHNNTEKLYDGDMFINAFQDDDYQIRVISNYFEMPMPTGIYWNETSNTAVFIRAVEKDKNQMIVSSVNVNNGRLLYVNKDLKTMPIEDILTWYWCGDYKESDINCH